MSKKGKGKKSHVSSTTVTDTTAADLPEYHYGTSIFKFPNGDQYEGDFCAHRIGLVWREGYGVYTTHDGHTYEGQWEKDKLVESKPVKVTFPSGAEYLGKLSKGKYSGPATYTLPNRMIISSDFNENKPTKETIIIDPSDKLWHGYTKTDEDYTYLLPENEFYLNIHDERGKGIRKIKPPKPQYQIEPEEQSTVEEEQEEIIFAKSTKTRNSLNFEDSLWYKKYANFKIKHDRLKEKIKEQSLNAEEEKWWGKYKMWRKNKRKSVAESGETLKSRETIPPVVVFYPRKQPGDVEAVCEEKSESLGEEERDLKRERLYEKLKNEKENCEKRLRQKLFENRNNNIYDRKLDETKNPDCSCGKRVCECLLQCI